MSNVLFLVSAFQSVMIAPPTTATGATQATDALAIETQGVLPGMV